MLWDLTKRVEAKDGDATLIFICNRATVRELKEARKTRLDAQRIIMSAAGITDPEEAIAAEEKIQSYQDAFVGLVRPMIQGVEVARNGSDPEPLDGWEAILDEKTDLLYEHYPVLLDALFFRRGGVGDRGHPGPGADRARPEAVTGAGGGKEDQGLPDDVPGKDLA